MSAWIKIAKIEEIPSMGSRVLQYKDEEIAIFKTKKGTIHAINNLCPHKQGKISEGLVHEEMVTCPLHNWDIDLNSGEAKNEEGCSKIYETMIKEDLVYIKL